MNITPAKRQHVRIVSVSILLFTSVPVTAGFDLTFLLGGRKPAKEPIYTHYGRVRKCLSRCPGRQLP